MNNFDFRKFDKMYEFNKKELVVEIHDRNGADFYG